MGAVAFLSPVVATVSAGLLPAADRAPADGRQEAGRQEAAASLAVDRWLVAEARPASPPVPAPGSARMEELAAAPRFLPDRDVVVEPAYWHLVRRDSAETFRADRLDGVPPPSDGTVLAHAYVRLPEDRTLRVAWTRPACGAGALWLNGQRLADGGSAGRAPAGAGPAARAGGAGGDGDVRADTVEARLAGGWNTLLLAVEAPGCPPAFGAALLPAGGMRSEAAAPGPGVHPDLERVRVQASRPPGAHRTWPRPWVTASAAAPARTPEWRSDDDRLRGAVAVRVVPWGRAPRDTLAVAGAGRPGGEGEAEAAGADSAEAGEGERPPDAPPDSAGRPPPGRGGPPALPGRGPGERPRPGDPPAIPPALPDRIRVRLEVAGESAERTLRDPAPTRAEAVEGAALPFEELREVALGDDGVEVRLEWGGEERELEGTLGAAELLRWLHGPIALTGWSPASGGAAALPEGAGASLTGRWRVPEALAGLELVLDAEGAPGRYALGDAPLRPEGGVLRLCGPCEEGRELRLAVETTDAWTGWPRARIAQGGFPAAAGTEGAPPAEAWLRALEGGDDNRAYVEMSRRHARGGAGTP